jgi:hypothetical protein
MTAVIARYLTESGAVGIEVTQHANGNYSFMGEWGTGFGKNRAEVRERVIRIVAFKRHARVVQAFEE